MLNTVMLNWSWATILAIAPLTISSFAQGEQLADAIQTANQFVRLRAASVRIDGGHLTYLDLRGSAFTDDQSELLILAPHLAFLSLSGCPVGDASLKALNNTKLEWLILDGTNVTSDGLRHLAGLPLRVLSLVDTAVDDRGLAEVAKIRPLRRVSVAQTRVTSAGLTNLKAMPALLDLDIRGIAIDDAAAEVLVSCKGLRRLQLTGTKLNDDRLDWLGRMSRLQTLEVALPEPPASVRSRIGLVD